MIAIQTSACNRTYVAPGCADLPVYQGEDFIVTWWRPDPEELAMIAAGMPIKLCFLGQSVPPVSLGVDTL